MAKPNKIEFSPYIDKESHDLVNAISGYDNFSALDTIVKRYSSYLFFFTPGIKVLFTSIFNVLYELTKFRLL